MGCCIIAEGKPSATIMFYVIKKHAPIKLIYVIKTRIKLHVYPDYK